LPRVREGGRVVDEANTGLPGRCGPSEPSFTAQTWGGAPVGLESGEPGDIGDRGEHGERDGSRESPEAPSEGGALTVIAEVPK
jgi:hypothetical protein